MPILKGLKILGITGISTQYASVKRSLKGSSSTRVFSGLNTEDGVLYANYVTIEPLGFTPLYVCCSSYNSKYVTHCATDPYWGWSFTRSDGIYKSLKDIMSTGTFYMPVAGPEVNALFIAFGYY